MQTFERLGIREELDRRFLPKYGGEIVAACGSKGLKFYFKNGFRVRRYLGLAAAAGIFLTSCAANPPHQFAQPSPDWKTRSGQLLYRNAKTTLIGDVIVRFSRAGDFDLTFSKGPGLTLFAIREDASFAEVKGALAGRGWSGPLDHAPSPLRGWLGLRGQFLDQANRRSIRYATGTETFLFHF